MRLTHIDVIKWELAQLQQKLLAVVEHRLKALTHLTGIVNQQRRQGNTTALTDLVIERAKERKHTRILFLNTALATQERRKIVAAVGEDVARSYVKVESVQDARATIPPHGADPSDGWVLLLDLSVVNWLYGAETERLTAVIAPLRLPGDRGRMRREQQEAERQIASGDVSSLCLDDPEDRKRLVAAFARWVGA